MFHSSHPHGHEPEHHAFSPDGKGTARAENAQGKASEIWPYFRLGGPLCRMLLSQKALRGVVPASLCLVLGAILWEIFVKN